MLVVIVVTSGEGCTTDHRVFSTSHINFGLGSKELPVVTLRNMFKCYIKLVMTNSLYEGTKTHKLVLQNNV